MKNYTKSNELLERELKVSPLASQTFSKSYRYFCQGVSPSYVDYAKGCYIYDVDGNEFIDFICALGPVTVGYNNEHINNAVKKQLEKGASFSLQSTVEVELAEKICKIVPCSEMVRFVKNGGDATSAAIRLARAYTGKDMVLMSGYHGMHDWSIGASENNKGIPKVVCELTKNFIYNDISDIEKKLNMHKGKVAAVILEPIQANGPKEGYLQELKELVHKHDAIFIFDEVVSGFRYALGGASELYKVTPDLAAFGKGMGNGYAISAIAGKKELMKQIEMGIFVSTTFGGDAVAMSAALAAMKILEQDGFYDNIWSLGRKMHSGLLELTEKYELQEIISVSGLPPHCGLSFEGIGNLTYLDIHSIYSQVMIENGILVFAICNLNGSHTEKEIDLYLEATEKAFQLIKKAIKQDSLTGILKGGKVDPIFKRNVK